MFFWSEKIDLQSAQDLNHTFAIHLMQKQGSPMMYFLSTAYVFGGTNMMLFPNSISNLDLQ